jgi:epoxyqueuosine reductase
MEPADLAREIKSLAMASGFDDCRVARAGRAPHADAFLSWLRDGCHGDMAWMARDPERRADPRIVLPGCRSVLVLAVNYFPGEIPPGPADGRATGRIARYAWNDDYHDLILPRLRALDARMLGLGGTQKCYVDTGPVLERDHASAAGLGWNGKSTVQIHRQLGTWFFLAAILTTLEAEPDKPARDHCGKCVRCIDACPTGAITAPHRVDARRCISYLTIEHKGTIPEHLRPLLGDRIYGCDDCLAACPWNRFARVSSESAYHAREEIFAFGLRDYLALDDDAFRSLFRRSPIKRIKRSRFLRNVCVALGNTGNADDLPALEAAALDPDPLISEHARWAIGEIRGRSAGAGA